MEREKKERSEEVMKRAQECARGRVEGRVS